VCPAILQWLLSEADFFVDEKDLQTFVGAAFQPRFFFARRLHGFYLTPASGGSGCRLQSSIT
jgi:hypothetical protein